MEDNIERGRVTVLIGGKQRFFRFGLSLMMAYTEAKGVDITALHEALAANPLRALIDLLVYALRDDADLPAKNAHLTVADWVEDMGQEDANKLVKAMMSGLTAVAENPLVAAMSQKQA